MKDKLEDFAGKILQSNLIIAIPCILIAILIVVAQSCHDRKVVDKKMEEIESSIEDRLDAAYQAGFKDGEADVYEDAYEDGYKIGYEDGKSDGRNDVARNYRNGYLAGYDNGYADADNGSPYNDVLPEDDKDLPLE